eukprot:363811-Chlamydomonas_euryale.AAC.3
MRMRRRLGQQQAGEPSDGRLRLSVGDFSLGDPAFAWQAIQLPALRTRGPQQERPNVPLRVELGQTAGQLGAIGGAAANPGRQKKQSASACSACGALTSQATQSEPPGRREGEHKVQGGEGMHEEGLHENTCLDIIWHRCLAQQHGASNQRSGLLLYSHVHQKCPCRPNHAQC